MRYILSEAKVSPEALVAIHSFHADVVRDVAAAVAANEWTVVGMAGNPFVAKARRHLESKGTSFKYLEYGSYLNGWKPRLAIKLWSGWPTFPQVFHNGVLIGGFTDLKRYLP